MSETKEAPKPTKQESQGILKKLTSGDTWVSPFRSQASEEDPKKKINLYKQFKESNKIEHIKVPVKFSYHPTLEAEAKRRRQLRLKQKGQRNQSNSYKH